MADLKACPLGTSKIGSVTVHSRLYGMCADSSANHNKYYTLELHEGGAGSGWRVYVDYGRVGKTGTRQEYLNPDGSALIESQARAFFASQSTSKFGRCVCSGCRTSNQIGAERCTLCQKVLDYKDYPKDKYIPVHLAQASVGSSEAKQIVDVDKLAERAKAQVQVVATSPVIAAPVYPPQIASLYTHIYEESGHVLSQKLNTGAIKATSDNPLGTLGATQLAIGKTVLDDVAKVLVDPKHRDGDCNSDLMGLTSRWYGTIPQAVGMKPDWKGLCLSTWQKHQAAADLLELLGDVKGVQNTFAGSSTLHDRYSAVGATVQVLDPSHPKYRELVNYVMGTRSDHHRFGRGMQVKQIFQIGVKSQAASDWLDPGKVGNLKPLFHGSRNANILGILSKGLLMRPPGVVITGSMFGNAVYFADCSTKSVQYSLGGWGGTSNRRNNCYLFVADVALGKVKGYRDAQSHLTAPPPGYHSVKGEAGSSLLHNEYMIYTLRQHRLSYLIDLEPGSRY